MSLEVLIALISWSCGILQGVAQRQNITDYAKLTLNDKELLGSRWTLEQNGSIIVYNSFQIVDILKVDTDAMCIRVDFHVRQRWTASGLDLPDRLFLPGDSDDVFIVAEESILDSIWSPKSFIPNARETVIHSVAASQSVVNIYKNKTMVWRSRMHSVLGCSFSFQWYPVDIQVCDLILESYQYSSVHVHYHWEPRNPLITDQGIILYQYELKLPPKYTDGYDTRWSGLNKFPYVKVTFKFERKLGNTVIQVFVPTTLVVTLSWFSFWLGLDAIPGRIALLITCILTLVTMHSSLKGAIPPVHYVKMMDIWMIVCMAFVFAAICEFIIVKYLQWREMQKAKADEDKEKYLKTLFPSGTITPPLPVPPQQLTNLVGNSQQNFHPYINYYAGMNSTGDNGNRPMPDSLTQRHHGVPPDVAFMQYLQAVQRPIGSKRPAWVNIDRVCRIMFPLLFCIFGITYWSILLTGSKQQHVND